MIGILLDVAYFLAKRVVGGTLTVVGLLYGMYPKPQLLLEYKKPAETWVRGPTPQANFTQKEEMVAELKRVLLKRNGHS